MNTNSIQVFENPAFGKIRTITKNDTPWFVGKDVATVLGYKRPADAITLHVEDDDKGVGILPTPGGKQKTTIINESGLYSLILSSKLPTAKEFKHWVTSEVLPTIRKYGVYATESALMNLIEDPENAIRIFQALRDERNARLLAEKEKLMLEHKVDEMEPLATYCREILATPQTVTVTQIAQDYGMSAIKMNEILRDMNIQYRQNEQWILYSKYKLEGYVHSNTVAYTRYDGTTGSKMFTRWTQKGRMFLYEKLKGMGILPLCEQTSPAEEN